jgi:luciferase family oxidoreductase group 1
MPASPSPILRLSVLDQAPVPQGHSPAQALQNSIELARHAEQLGYHRFWMSEHHAMDTLACTAPEVMLARIGAETHTIRIGSGGIMLPHYSPLKVAECFRTLHALYPGRVDLGIGRAPGGGPIESQALRRDRTGLQLDDFGEQLPELLALLDGTLPPSHPFSRITVSPAMPGGPDVWLLGSSLWSSSAAAQLGLPYAFAHFFSPIHTRQAIEAYQRHFIPGTHRRHPEAMAAVGVLCAPTTEEAEYLHASVRLLQRRIRQGDRRPIPTPQDALRELGAPRELGATHPSAGEEGEWPRYFVGDPAKVHRELTQMAAALDIEELVVVTITHSQQARLDSYRLLAKAFSPPASTGPQEIPSVMQLV